MDSIIGNRLKETIKALGVNNTKFAAALSIAPNYVSMMISGKKTISNSLKMNISKTYPQINLGYLETGQLPILKFIKTNKDQLDNVLKKYIDNHIELTIQSKLDHIKELCNLINKGVSTIAFNLEDFRNESEENLKSIDAKIKP